MKRILNISLLILFLSISVFAGDIQHVGPGVTHSSIVNDIPLSIQVVKVDLTNPNLEFIGVPGNDDLVTREQPSEVSKRLSKSGYEVIAAINADFWGSTSTPLGMTVQEGKLLVSPYSRSAFSIDRNNEPLISLFTLELSLIHKKKGFVPVGTLNRWDKSTEVSLYSSGWKTSPKRDIKVFDILMRGKQITPDGEVNITITDINACNGETPIPEGYYCLQIPCDSYYVGRFASGQRWRLICEILPDVKKWDTVIGGGPRIVKDGKVCVKNIEEHFSEGFSTTAHPRSCIGYSEDGNTLIMAVVDGRQPGFSNGISLEDLAKFMIEQGAYQAMNLDGGGSSCMVVRNNIVNRPSDNAGERPTCNTFCVVSTAPLGKLTHLEILPDKIKLASTVPYQFSVKGYDKYWNPVEVDNVIWFADSKNVTIDLSGKVVAGKGQYEITAKAGDIECSETIDFVPIAKGLETIKPVALELGKSRRLEINIFDDDGEELYLPDESVEINILSGSGLKIKGDEITGESKGSGELIVKIGDNKRKIKYLVDDPVITMVEDFEKSKKWGIRTSVADENECKFNISDKIVHDGKYSGELNYKLLRGNTSAVYVDMDCPLEGNPDTFSIWVYGDGGDHLMRAIFTDPDGESFLMDLTSGILWKDEWKKLEGNITKISPYWSNPHAQWDYPLTLKTLYIAEPRGAKKNSGVIYFDSAEISEPPSIKN